MYHQNPHTESTMAPGILVSPSTTDTAEPEVFKGPKEAFVDGPKKYNKLAEEQGTDKQPPASHPNYLPVWDAEKK